MRFNPEVHHRRSIRLPGWDYSWPGAYFVTMCTQHRVCLFGEIVQDQLALNEARKIVWSVWQALPERFPTVALDAFVVMPNHVHAILLVGARLTAPSSADGNISPNESALRGQGAASRAPTLDRTGGLQCET